MTEQTINIITKLSNSFTRIYQLKGFVDGCDSEILQEVRELNKHLIHKQQLEKRTDDLINLIKNIT